MESGADCGHDPRTRARDNDGPDADAHGILHGSGHGELEREGEGGQSSMNFSVATLAPTTGEVSSSARAL